MVFICIYGIVLLWFYPHSSCKAWTPGRRTLVRCQADLLVVTDDCHLCRWYLMCIYIYIFMYIYICTYNINAQHIYIYIYVYEIIYTYIYSIRWYHDYIMIRLKILIQYDDRYPAFCSLFDMYMTCAFLAVSRYLHCSLVRHCGFSTSPPSNR